MKAPKLRPVEPGIRRCPQFGQFVAGQWERC